MSLPDRDILDHPKRVLAVDPGLSGAVCVLGRGQLVVFRDFKLRADISRAIVTAACSLPDIAIMEFVHAMPGEGVCSVWSFARSAGTVDGAVAVALPGMKLEEVSPQKWQNYFRKAFEIPKGTDFDSRAIASVLFPEHVGLFTRVKDHNTADAVLIAVWRLVQSSLHS